MAASIESLIKQSNSKVENLGDNDGYYLDGKGKVAVTTEKLQTIINFDLLRKNNQPGIISENGIVLKEQVVLKNPDNPVTIDDGMGGLWRIRHK